MTDCIDRSPRLGPGDNLYPLFGGLARYRLYAVYGDPPPEAISVYWRDGLHEVYNLAEVVGKYDGEIAYFYVARCMSSAFIDDLFAELRDTAIDIVEQCGPATPRVAVSVVAARAEFFSELIDHVASHRGSFAFN